MISECIIYLMYLTVCILSPLTSSLSNFMYFFGTWKFKEYHFIYNSTPNNDVLTVLTWFLHMTSVLVFQLINAPILNIIFQVFLGTVIQHMLWTAFNNEKRYSKPNLFVPFWFLPYWEMWSVITITLLPMSVGIYLV